MKRKIRTNLSILILGIFSFFYLASCSNNASNESHDCDSSHVQADSTHAGQEHAAWDYEGDNGPAHWATIEGCGDCDNTMQSPIDITGAVVSKELAALKLTYKAVTSIEILNNGHTVQINYPAGSILTFNGKDYELKQFHFHAPSEHTVNGTPYPAEVHLVHKTPDGAISVIGILIKEGAENAFIKSFIAAIPKEADKTVKFDVNIDINQILPKSKAYYNYSGSLTTPPCTEAVNWIVMKEVIEINKVQLTTLEEAMPDNNARPVQPLNNRVIQVFE